MMRNGMDRHGDGARGRQGDGATGREGDGAEGFTLLELVIVMGLAAVLAVITISSSGRITANNRGTTCMMNLRHLHQGLMMYRADYDAYPAFLYPNPDDGNSPARLGMWALHTYDGTPAAEAPYLKSYKRLKCPHDDQRTNEATVTWPSPQAPNATSPPFLILPPSPTPNPFTGFAGNYNSYQTIDPDDGEATYESYRGVANSTDPNYLRQILPPSCVYDPGSSFQGTGGCPVGYTPRYIAGGASPCVSDPSSRFQGQLTYDRSVVPPVPFACGATFRPRSLGLSMQKWEPRGDTVVTWCAFHRDKGQPRQYDNVLFLDGSVQLLPSHLAMPASYEVEASCTECTNGAGVGQGCLQVAAGVRTYTPKVNLLWQRCQKKGGT